MRPPTWDFYFYQLLSQRFELNDSDQRTLARLRKGYEGECRLDASIQAAGLNPIYLQDVWLPSREGPATRGSQLDGVLVLPDCLVLLEAKHYSGSFRYQGKKSLLNNRPYHHNLINQLENHVEDLRQFIESRNLPPIPIRALLIFTDDQLALEGTPGYFLTYAQWLDLLGQLAIRPPLASQSLYLRALSPWQFQNPHRPRQLAPVEEQLLRRGLLCRKCGWGPLERSRYKCSCPACDFSENKSRCYLRALYEFALLHPDQAITRRAVLDFLGEDANPKLVSKLLAHYAQQQAHGHGANVPYAIAQPHLKLHELLENPDQPMQIH